jgi:hypothetical protein
MQQGFGSIKQSLVTIEQGNGATKIDSNQNEIEDRKAKMEINQTEEKKASYNIRNKPSQDSKPRQG